MRPHGWRDVVIALPEEIIADQAAQRHLSGGRYVQVARLVDEPFQVVANCIS
jgi:hypothetical protein